MFRWWCEKKMKIVVLFFYVYKNVNDCSSGMVSLVIHTCKILSYLIGLLSSGFYNWSLYWENIFLRMLNFTNFSHDFIIIHSKFVLLFSIRLLPSKVSGYFSTVLRQVSKRRPLTLIINFSSCVVRSFRLTAGALGNWLFAIGTQPIAAALAYWLIDRNLICLG